MPSRAHHVDSHRSIERCGRSIYVQNIGVSLQCTQIVDPQPAKLIKLNKTNKMNKLKRTGRTRKEKKKTKISKKKRWFHEREDPAAGDLPLTVERCTSVEEASNFLSRILYHTIRKT